MTERKPMEVTNTVIVLRESMWQSIISDTYSAAAIVAVIGVGVVCGSVVMQWAGFVVLALVFSARVSGKKKAATKTPQEAADFLRDTFNVKAN